jgi:DNA-binding winged helix-turn-helix (wHTH) protein
MPSAGVLTFGPFRLDPATESIWREGVETRLRPKTFAVLRHLAERPGRLVTKDDLLAAIWTDVEVGEAALTVCVNEIRRALGDEARAPRFVETVHRRGYRFIGPVQTGAGPAAGAPPAELVGRREELAARHGWLEQVRRGERRVGFITGEAGIGKTTLIEAFLSSIASSDCRIARGQCLEHYGSGEAYLWFTEGFDTADLRAARAFLDELQRAR